MSVDPLRLLMRGCKRSKSTAGLTNTANRAANASLLVPSDAAATRVMPTRLEPELDFFGTGHGTPPDDAAASPPSAESAPSTQVARDVTTTDGHASLHELVEAPQLRRALSRMHIARPTPVQRRAMPSLLRGDDVVAIAPTGSGKTLAYALPLLTHVLCKPDAAARAPVALVLAPTRELAHQISRVFARLAQEGAFRLRLVLLTSRAGLSTLSATSTAPHVVVATPQTAIAALDATALVLKGVRHIVLDEADELLQHKFVAQVDTILAAGDAHREDGARVHLFSATLPAAVDELARSLLSRMHKVVVDGGAYGGAAAVNKVSDTIAQSFRFVGGRGEQGKVMAMRGLLKDGLKPPILVFVQSKDRAAELFRELIYDGVQVDAIHGDRTAAARASAVARFRAGKIWVLIATDILARGLDFLSVNTVINYDMPSSATAYVHRIGRTGRNGRSGSAITFFTEEDKQLVGAVVKVARASGADVPDWLVTLAKKVRPDELKRLERRPPKRKQLGGPNRASLKMRHRKRQKLDGDKGDEGDSDTNGEQIEVIEDPKKQAASLTNGHAAKGNGNGEEDNGKKKNKKRRVSKKKKVTT